MNNRQFSVTVGNYAANSTDVLPSTVQDVFPVPMDCELVGVTGYATSVAGTNARSASLDCSTITTNVDSVFTAAVAGPTGNGITVTFEDDTADVKASLDMATVTTNIDTVIQAASAGNGGDHINVVVFSGGAAWLAENAAKKIVYISLNDAVSTVTNFETLVGTSSLIEVGSAGTGANVFDASTDCINEYLAGGYKTASSETQASLDLATVTADIDTVICAVALGGGVMAGDDANDYKVSIIGGASANAGEVIEDVDNKHIIFKLKNNGSTVADFETLVGTCTLLSVKTGGTGANKFYTAKDSVDGVYLSGGVSPAKCVVSGNSITFKCADGVTTVADIENTAGASAECSALVSAASGTGGNIYATATDAATGTLAGGNPAKPTIDIYDSSGNSVLSSALSMTSASVVEGSLARKRLPLQKGDYLTARITTTSTDGAITKPFATLLFEY